MSAVPQVQDPTQFPDAVVMAGNVLEVKGPGSITPAQAVQRPTAFRPPHAEVEEQSSVSFDQACQGLHMYYRRWRRADAAYQAVNEALTGQRPPAIISYPTGAIDENGQQIIYEFDLNALAPKGLPDEERLKIFKAVLGPMNNYLVQEWQKWLGKLAQCAMIVHQHVSQGG